MTPLTHILALLNGAVARRLHGRAYRQGLIFGYRLGIAHEKSCERDAAFDRKYAAGQVLCAGQNWRSQ